METIGEGDVIGGIDGGNDNFGCRDGILRS